MHHAQVKEKADMTDQRSTTSGATGAGSKPCLSGTARCPHRYRLRAPADMPPHFHGAYAEYHVVKPGQWVFNVPDELPDDLVAPANCALSQVVYALHRIGVWLGDTIVIQGAG